jgi:hypothetical protein
MKLAELRELSLPPTTVAEQAWELARHRRRRKIAGVAVATAVVLGVTAVGVGTVRGGTSPAPAPAPAPNPSTPPEPTITDLPDFAALARTVPTLAATDPTYLSEDPVDRAVVAILPQWTSEDGTLTVVDVLGSDGHWRFVDVPGLVPTRDRGGYEGPVLNPTSLNAAGTRLALPQPDRVVVVDLTTGDYSSYGFPGLNNAVVWQDDDHLVVTEEGARNGRILGLSDLSITDSPFTGSTGFAPDGSSVTWGPSRELVSSDGSRVLADVANEGGLQPTSPLVDDQVAVGIGDRNLTDGSTTYAGVPGVAVVDRHSGDLRGFLYTASSETGPVPTYLMGLDGDTVTIATAVSPDYSRLLVLRWSWRTGEVTPVETVEAGMVTGSP